LPPFRLPQVVQQIGSGLEEFGKSESDSEATAAAQALGERLGKQGLGLRSLLALQRALVQEGLKDPPDTQKAEQVARLHAYLTFLVEGLASHELQAVSVQRNEMQVALERAVQNREAELRQVIHDLSTPVMPVYEQILVLPLIGQIDSERANRITERLLNEVTEQRASIIIIDITGVPAIDKGVASDLMRTARAVRLLGVCPVLVGVRAELARVVVQLGVDLSGMVVLANLQEGIEWALRELDLSILRRPSARAPQPASAASPDLESAAGAKGSQPRRRQTHGD
jgi:rsbT co-antagonist protein RsbR